MPRDVSSGGLVCYRTLLSGYHYDWMQRSQVRPYYFCDNERLPQYATERVPRERAGSGICTGRYQPCVRRPRSETIR